MRTGPRVFPVVCLVGMLASACASTGLPIARQQAGARSPHRPSIAAVTLESSDPALSAALATLAVSPTAEAHRHVASEYRRLGVLDQAHAYFTKAAKLDPHDATALDALARIWRDWGFPKIGMSDAQRAVQVAPTSAWAANTVGTLFEAEGDIRQARQWYERALRLDSNASYALNNLCYSAVLLDQPDAIPECWRALEAAPGSRAVRNNLGLAYAAAGDIEKATALFDGQADSAYAQYNLGIVYMSRGQYEKALAAFIAAMKVDALAARAAERATQARQHIETEGRHR